MQVCNVVACLNVDCFTDKWLNTKDKAVTTLVIKVAMKDSPLVRNSFGGAQ